MSSCSYTQRSSRLALVAVDLMLDTTADDDEGDGDSELTEARLSMFPEPIKVMFKEGGTFAKALKALNTRKFHGARPVY